MFRVKKRDTELASLGDTPANMKKQRAGSVDNLLDTDDDEHMFSADSTASESEPEDGNKVSKMQKIFAKKSIKREKRREKEHKKKVEKNLISMEDFLSKQSEFKMWLYEEKSKNVGDMSSPKLKSLFKQFVHAWNKRKLPAKYYKSSLASDDSPLTQRKHNFMMGEGNSCEPLQCDPEADDDREKPSSPFVTFGKTPPKVFKSKRLQLFGGKPDVALISVAPIGSSSALAVKSNKENILDTDEPSQYMTPGKLCGGPATPYKVSVFPWAMADESGTHSLEVCSTATPPNTSFGVEENEDWPPPPSEEEINASASKTTRARSNDSPQVPPPPPPRSESLTVLSPAVPNSYADPIDKISSTSSQLKECISVYQEPVDTIIRINTRTKPDNPRLVLQSFSQNDEPDTSLYCKPINDEIYSYSSLCLKKKTHKSDVIVDFKPIDSIVPDIVQCSQPPNGLSSLTDNVEELYAKPVKKKLREKQATDTELISDIQTSENTDSNIFRDDNNVNSSDDHLKKEPESDLYAEIMTHINKTAHWHSEKQPYRPDPIYETIDECYEKLNSETEPTSVSSSPTQIKANSQTEACSHLSKGKKKSVLAASSDKIYETYLCLRGNPNLLKSKVNNFNDLPAVNNVLNKKFRSQPDISFSENCESSLRSYQDLECELGKKESTVTVAGNDFFNTGTSSKAHRAVSMENGLKDSDCPGTPTIMATASFDSLCAVTPLSKRSGSSQSLPNKTGSFESLSTHESSMSVSSRSTLSVIPDEDDLRLLESFEEDSTNLICSNLTEIKQRFGEQEKSVSEDKQINTLLDDNAIKEKFEDGNIPITPGKISAAKHGIDLSVYILKPPVNDIKGEHAQGTGSVKDPVKETALGLGMKASNETHRGVDTQAKLAIKDKISSSKGSSVVTGKREQERRHTVQTVQEYKKHGSHMTGLQPSVPSIGIASKTHKAGVVSKPGKSKCQPYSGSEVTEPDSKRQCVGGTKIVGHGDDLYLETDIDTVITEKGRLNLKKSKSHGSLEQGSSTVITEIW